MTITTDLAIEILYQIAQHSKNSEKILAKHFYPEHYPEFGSWEQLSDQLSKTKEDDLHKLLEKVFF